MNIYIYEYIWYYSRVWKWSIYLYLIVIVENMIIYQQRLILVEQACGNWEDHGYIISPTAKSKNWRPNFPVSHNQLEHTI